MITSRSLFYGAIWFKGSDPLIATAGASSLEVRLGGLALYDHDRDITWLANANAGAGSTFDDGASSTDGRMTWASANAWAASLTVGGFTDWRLPTTVQPDPSCGFQTGDTPPQGYGANCTGSEIGHLFYDELGVTAGSSILTSTDPDLALFSNVQTNYYWSGTEFAPDPIKAWSFLTDGGSQLVNNKYSSYFAWAVRSGDVSVVPIPAAVWLLGSGLIGLLAVARGSRVQGV